MQIQYGSFSKRENSTARPASLAKTADAEVTEECSIVNPVLKLGYSAWSASYNYVYIPLWGSYYFVSDARVTPGRVWYVTLSMDFAATYKESIKNTSAYIIYADSANSEIVDTRLPIKTSPAMDYRTSNVPYLSQTGTYLLSIVGAAYNDGSPTQNGTKGPRTYALSAGALSNILSSVQAYVNDIGSQSTDSMGAILAIGRQLVAAGSVAENIRGCTWVPWDVVSMSDVTNEPIWLGLFNASEGRVTEVAGYAIDVPVKAFTASVAIPWTFSDWRRNSPYTQIYLYIPFVGMVQLSSENLVGQSQIDVTVALNRLTGVIDCQVKAGGQMLGTYSASTGISIPVGAAGAPGTLAAVGALAHGAAMVAGVIPNGAGAANVLGTIAAASHIAPNTITAGNLSGGAGIGLDTVIACYVVAHDTAVSPSSVGPTIGVPYNKSVTIGTVSGFVQCSNASVQGAMPSVAREMINNMLNTGIFIE